jgi:hypothetical protein
MPDANAGLPPRYLRTPEAARFLSLSGRTLEKHRTYGTGSAYRKIGGRVVYVLDDLKAWADRGTKTSTSDPGNGAALRAKRQAAPVPYAGKSRRWSDRSAICRRREDIHQSVTGLTCFAHCRATRRHGMRRT